MVRRLILPALLAVLVTAGCDEAPAGSDDLGPAPGWAEVIGTSPVDLATAPRLSSTALVTRLSLDLRGVRPEPDELARVEDDPGELPDVVDAFLASPRFGERVRDLYAEVLRTRVEDFPIGAEDLGVGEEELLLYYASIGEEPLRMLERIATEDRPWTDVVTADWTMADERLATLWPLDYPPGVEGWRVAHYTDGRPAAGLLSTNALWWRYLSNGVNYGRGRANAVARIFLCADFLDRPVDFPRDIDLTDEAGIRDAVANNTGCVSCHAGLDPLASYLAGFQYTDRTAAEMSVYHPERELRWREMTGRPPGFYGSPGYAMTDLGAQIAADPRFVTCAVETAWELLLRRPVNTGDRGELDALTRHREAFLAGGLTLRSLFRSIVLDPRYALAAPAAEPKVVTPDQWGATLEAWTGFRFTIGGVDVLKSDTTGLRTLAGGGDGRAGGAPAAVPTATMALSWARTAEAAAAWAAEYPVGPLHGPDLLDVDPDATPETAAAFDDPAMRAQIQALHRRLFGTRVVEDGLEVEATLELWDQVARIEGPRGAWAAVLTSMFRDPSLALY